MDFDSVLLVKPEVLLYKIPPRTTNRGYKASDWNLQCPMWSGRVRVVTRGDELFVRFEDKSTGELFAESHIKAYPGVDLESVVDSSRYFVLQIASGAQHAFIGMGFAERGDSFDLQAAVQDHFRYIKTSREIAAAPPDMGSNKDYSLGSGQKITLKLKSGPDGKPVQHHAPAKSAAGGVGGLLLPPPPSSSGKVVGQAAMSAPAAATATATAAGDTFDDWGDFSSGSGAPASSGTDDWVQF